MIKKVDIGSKRLISLAPDNWVQWVTQRKDIWVKEFISSEFQWISRDNDVLIKVENPEGEFLILNELQLRYKETMPLRMRAYIALAEERYNLPIYPVLINILPHVKTPNIPNFYQQEFMGMKSYQDYRVINLWEIEADLVFAENLSSLLPFVPILKGGGEEAVVRKAVIKLRENEQLSDLEPLLSFFAAFVLEMPIVQQIMRWDMIVLRESPWYQEILKEGEKRGLQQGELRGEQRGKQEGEANLVIRLLSKRFGNLDQEITSQIRQLSSPQLETLGESIFDFSAMADLENWLQQNTD
ncbi:Rpn family recombination-promoting nuclease/putative transposase [Dolichospermum sp. ST_con]|jgi:predicted transposase YdaD|nr:Rpn family recombination-promoting nuclease/putative transposase [Dolichospermum sp. ST_con]MDD1419021.1 Rpn family recombination-promoting nuclease/putative transposase [Dolichospermum sp. ST_sed1]MDD1424989.1 Rpn family recombination-promoting nuclease/putative transposase [Dolichospermum sp. ST_sed9]MDD1429615.1 Rpn family recombination-promoting nuclease/putative transposase [Dolichospermum sp. ST_sed6]MDD1435885.1 Rpn family recombination-promoting nuclease/putative transposase [Dolicho